MPSFLQYDNHPDDEMDYEANDLLIEREYDEVGFGTVHRLISIRNWQTSQRDIDMKFQTVLDSQTGLPYQRGVEMVVPFHIEESLPDVDSWVEWVMSYGANGGDGTEGTLASPSVDAFIENTFHWLSDDEKTEMRTDARLSLGKLYETVMDPPY